ncbi:hypothetical protein COCVIDRAFT_87417, partial [Bipolaris victoriae FI3]
LGGDAFTAGAAAVYQAPFYPFPTRLAPHAASAYIATQTGCLLLLLAHGLPPRVAPCSWHAAFQMPQTDASHVRLTNPPSASHTP